MAEPVNKPAEPQPPVADEVKPDENVNKTPFTDITVDTIGYDAILYLYENDILKGVSETEFGPDTILTRGMFVTALGRLAGIDTALYTGTAFSDVDESMYYAPYIKWASDNGIVLGMGDGTFDPDGQLTHWHISLIMERFAKLNGKLYSETDENPDTLATRLYTAMVLYNYCK